MRTAPDKIRYLDEKYSPFPFEDEFMVYRDRVEEMISDCVNLQASLSGVDIFILKGSSPVWIGTQECSNYSYRCYIDVYDYFKLETFDLMRFGLSVFDDFSPEEKRKKLENLFPDVISNNVFTNSNEVKRLLSVCFSSGIGVYSEGITASHKDASGIALLELFASIEEKLIIKTNRKDIEVTFDFT